MSPFFNHSSSLLAYAYYWDLHRPARTDIILGSLLIIGLQTYCGSITLLLISVFLVEVVVFTDENLTRFQFSYVLLFVSHRCLFKLIGVLTLLTHIRSCSF
jgi:hypothetical protein